LAYVTGLVYQELLLQNEYLAAENRILKAHSPRNLWLSDGERSTLAEIGKRLGRKGLQQVARLAKPDTILGWYRQLVAAKFDGSKQRRCPADRASVQRSRIWWFVWPAKTLAGVTIGLWERWLTWGTQSPTRPWATSCAGTASRPYRREAKRPPGGISFVGNMDVLAGTDFFTVEVLTWEVW
jgi:putative transposase